jgi:DNA polymerase I-like protein with 3'-5' exonuclease and polymerase domains
MVKDGDNWRATSPKLTEDSYDSLPPGLGKAIAEYNTLKHRRNFLKNADGKGAIASAISGNGRVQAEAFTCATNTSRYRHQGVVCNIPRVGSAYGEEFRSLFIVPEDSWMIGVDLSGIEARCLAHHILNGGYKDAEATADLILSPDKGSDFHSYNAKVWGCDRNTAKSVIYALLYGAGAKKLASILGRKESQGAKIKKEFYKAHPAIKQLMDALEKAYGSRGYLLGADGRPLYVRGVSRLLNTLLQQTAAVLFKKWMVYLDDVASEFLSAYGALPKQLLAYHDELGYELTGSRELAEHWGKLTCQAALEVGRDHGFYVPMAAEYKCGKSWRDTH